MVLRTSFAREEIGKVLERWIADQWQQMSDSAIKFPSGLVPQAHSILSTNLSKVRVRKGEAETLSLSN